MFVCQFVTINSAPFTPHYDTYSESARSRGVLWYISHALRSSSLTQVTKRRIGSYTDTGIRLRLNGQRQGGEVPPMLFRGYSILLLCPAPIRWRLYAMLTIVCLSVCQSVCLVPDPNSRTEGRSKLKFGKKEPHDTGYP